MTDEALSDAVVWAFLCGAAVGGAFVLGLTWLALDAVGGIRRDR